MPLSGSDGLATASGSTEGSGAFGLRPRLRRPPCRSGCSPSFDLRLLSRRRFRRGALQLRLARLQSRQAIGTPAQIARQCITGGFPEPMVLRRIRLLRLREHSLHLGGELAGHPVRVQRRGRLHLGSVQRHQSQTDQTRFPAEPQDVKEHGLHLPGVALSEPCDHRVIGNMLADDEAIAGIAAAQPLDRSARPDPVAVGVDQQGQQHPRRERGLTGASDLAGRLEGRQVHQTDRVDDQVDDVVARQPVHHVDRKKKPLPSIRHSEELRHVEAPRAPQEHRITTCDRIQQPMRVSMRSAI